MTPMNSQGVERLSIDYAQQQIETALGRLSARFQPDERTGKRRWGAEIIDGEIGSWVAYIQPGNPDDPSVPSEDAIYFMDRACDKAGYAVVWADGAPAAVYTAEAYAHKLSAGNRYFGFDLAEDCQWQPLTDSEDKQLVAKLLDALPSTARGQT